MTAQEATCALLWRAFLSALNEENFPDSLSPKLDTSRQSSKQSRRDLLHPCQFLRDSFGDLVKFDHVRG